MRTSYDPQSVATALRKAGIKVESIYLGNEVEDSILLLPQKIQLFVLRSTYGLQIVRAGATYNDATVLSPVRRLVGEIVDDYFNAIEQQSKEKA